MAGRQHKLNKRQALFVEYYLRCKTPTEAARLAGYSQPGQLQWQLMQNPTVRKEIDRLMSGIKVNPDEVLLRLAQQARNEGAQYLLPSGEIDFAGIIRDGKQHLIKSITKTKYGFTVTFYDAQHALELVGKHLGLLTDRIEINGDSTGRIEIVEVVAPITKEDEED